MSEERIIRNMRHMAWERAKGEMQAMLHTYWNDDERYKQIEKEIADFIKLIEFQGLYE